MSGHAPPESVKSLSLSTRESLILSESESESDSPETSVVVVFLFIVSNWLLDGDNRNYAKNKCIISKTK